MKTAYILGAGASAHAGVPLLGEIRQTAKRLAREGGDSMSPRYRSVLDQVVELWETRAPNADIEEFYTLCHMTYSHYGVHTRELDYLIAQVLAKASEGSRTSTTYTAFATKLLERHGSGQFAVISLNWDDLLDRAVEALPDQSVAYHTSSETRWLHAPDQTRNGTFPILKPHGSINWLYCRWCETVWLERDSQNVVDTFFGNRYLCPKHETTNLLYPSFIPPSIESWRTFPWGQMMGLLWNGIGIVLNDIDELTIIGWSVPSTDLMFRLWCIAQLNENEHLQKITFVSRPKVSERKELFESQCRKFVSSLRSSPPYEIRYAPFEDFVHGLADN